MPERHTTSLARLRIGLRARARTEFGFDERTTNVGSLTNFADRVSGLDNPWTRLPIVAIAALALWLGLLTLCGFLLRGLVPAVSAPAAIDARLIELPGARIADFGRRVSRLSAKSRFFTRFYRIGSGCAISRSENITLPAKLDCRRSLTDLEADAKVARLAAAHHPAEDSPNRSGQRQRCHPSSPANIPPLKQHRRAPLRRPAHLLRPSAPQGTTPAQVLAMVWARPPGLTRARVAVAGAARARSMRLCLVSLTICATR